METNWRNRKSDLHIPACGPFYLVTRINLAGTAEDLQKWKKVGVLSFESGADMGFFAAIVKIRGLSPARPAAV
jgi:uncharacterized membrane protein